MEHINANDEQRTRIAKELQNYRETAEAYIVQMHPHLRFVHLSEMLETHSSLINRTVFLQAMDLFSHRLQSYGSGYTLLDPQRVWVGIESSGNKDPYFGGFYHQNQGYRYLQQIAIFSLSGSLCGHQTDRILVTLELIRSYVHDVLHHNTYRLFLPLEKPSASGESFYRAQYGINPRLADGTSYSAKDAVSSPTTRNLGNIMEAATDRFAHELVTTLAERLAYHIPTAEYRSRDLCQTPGPNPIADYIYRDCTGKLASMDMCFLRELERGTQTLPVSENFKIYLKNMRLFVQYVTLRYRRFLGEFDPQGIYHLHETILTCMLAGDIEQFRSLLNTILPPSVTDESDGFAALFHTS